MSAPPKVAAQPAGAAKDSQDSGPGSPAFILALDVGTTCVRSFVLDEQCEVRGSAVDAVSDSIFK